MIQFLCKFVRSYLHNEEGVAAVEAALTLPVLMVLMAGVYDVGQAIVINQKTVVAAQIVGDLIARSQIVDTADIEDIVTAGALAVEPYDSTALGYDIVSVSFDDDGTATALWRVTEGMEQNQEALTKAEEVAEAGEGVIVVTTSFNYTPAFSHYFLNDINLSEVSLLRGRRSAVINCSDCS